MSTTRAYQRMRAESRNEFEPKSIIFAPAIKANDNFTPTDWVDSFALRAGAVYHAITKKPATSKTISEAKELLTNIAENCRDLILAKHSAAAAAAEAPPEAAAAEAPRAAAAAAAAATETATAAAAAAPEPAPTPTPAAEGEMISDELSEYADAIYLVLVFLPDLKKLIEDSKAVREAVDKFYELNGRQEIIRDIVKYENQLPLSTITGVFKFVGKAIEKTKNAYSLDKNPIDPLAESIDKYSKRSFSKDFYELLHPFCWYYSPFSSSSSSKLKNPDTKFKREILQKNNLLECLHYSIRPDTTTDEEVGGKVCHIPAAAKKLRRSGIRFLPREEGTMRIKFEEPYLHIPALVCDFKLETVAKNLMAWEKLKCEGQKPVTRYFQLMNELVQDVRDVRVMRKAGVLRGAAAKGRGLEELALVKRVDGNAYYPSVYLAVDGEVDKARKFYDKRMKSFLVRNHPTLVWVSSVAAASVIATAIYASRRKGVN
ncbi:uncharacterized protein [Typha angustifolia]|uniref:uncharacterized protein isoform X2 n=1 Tax=Typha angustifolia TaxID=59011 RepID=UPI003C2E75F6